MTTYELTLVSTYHWLERCKTQTTLTWSRIREMQLTVSFRGKKRISVYLSAFSCSTHIKQVYINDGQYNQVEGNSVAEQKCEQHLILWSFSAIQAFEFLSFLFLLFCRQWKNLLRVSTYFMEGLVTSRLENTGERWTGGFCCHFNDWRSQCIC